MTDDSATAIDKAFGIYQKELTMCHMGLLADHHHITIADGMRRILYALGILNDSSNHEIVERAIKKAKKIRNQAR